MKITIHDNFTEAVANALANGATRAEHLVAVQAAKDTAPYVPFLTGSLNARTQPRGNEIIYPGPYARYLYYGKVMVDESGKGPLHYVDKNGDEVFRFKKGSKLHASDKDLVFTKSFHPDAQSHWFEASKAENLDKWLRVAAKAVTDE